MPKRTSACRHGRNRTRDRGFVPQLALEATVGIEPAIGVLQTPALPLGYVAISLQSENGIPPAFLKNTGTGQTLALPLGYQAKPGEK